jgi:hypothetical protein
LILIVNLDSRQASYANVGSNQQSKNMKLLVITLLTISTLGFAQTTQNQRLTVKEQANVMGQLLLTGDYDKFLNFMYPDAVVKMGGKERIMKMITDGRVQMEKNGITIKSVEFGEPSELLTKDKTIQCIIPQLISMKVKGGTLKSKASLFAISSDNGANWTFLDVTTKTKEQLKATIPVFHAGLSIPTPTDPIFYKD